MINKYFFYYCLCFILIIQCHHENDHMLEQYSSLAECPKDTTIYARSSTFQDGFFLAVVCIDSIMDKKGNKMKPKCPPPSDIKWSMLEPVMESSVALRDSFKKHAKNCNLDSCSVGHEEHESCNYLISPLNAKTFKTIFFESNDVTQLAKFFVNACLADSDAMRDAFLSVVPKDDLINTNHSNPDAPFYKRTKKQFPCIYRVVRVVGKCQCGELFIRR